MPSFSLLHSIGLRFLTFYGIWKFVVRLAEHRSFGRVKLTDTLAGKDHIQRVFSSFCQDFAKITVFVDGEVLHLIYVDVAWRLSSL